MFTEESVKKVAAAELESVEVRSALTCEAKKGICSKCYGVSLSNNLMVQKGEAVGVVAAQSIGEPGTQLTLRTFHVGGIAGNISEDSRLVANHSGELVIDDLKTVDGLDSEGNPVKIVISRTTEFKIIDKSSGITLGTNNIPYGSHIFVEDKGKVKKGDVICSWDPYNGVIVSEFSGKAEFEDVLEGVTYQVEMDEQTGFKEKVISDSKKKRVIPTLHVKNSKGEITKVIFTSGWGALMLIEEGQKIEAGQILVKIPRKSGKAGDITGGLPRVTELFEARNPSNPAVVSEIDGVISFGKIKRGNREIIVESKLGDVKKVSC